MHPRLCSAQLLLLAAVSLQLAVTAVRVPAEKPNPSPSGVGIPSSSTSSSSFLLPLQLNAAKITNPEGQEQILFVQNTIQMEVGNPPQKFNVVFDTGSYSPVFLNESCTGDCGRWNKYNSALSVTANVSSIQVQDDYGAGNYHGLLATDTARLTAVQQSTPIGVEKLHSHDSNGAPVVGLELQGLEFLLAERVHLYSNSLPLVTQVNNSGILGISPRPSRSRKNDPSTTARLLEKGIKMVSVWAPRSDLFQPFAGLVEIGGYKKILAATTTSTGGDETRSTTPTWFPISTAAEGNGWGWYFYLEDFRVNGVSTGECSAKDQNCQVILDTGAGSLFLTTHVPNASKIPLFFNCSDESKWKDLPTLTWVMSNTSFTMEPYDYVYQFDNKSSVSYGLCQCLLGGDDFPSGETKFKDLARIPAQSIIRRTTPASELSGLQSTAKGGGTFPQAYSFQDFGILWMRRFTTVFDFGENRIGMFQHS